jgi:rsbT co-antagonist protein RsbR
MKLADVDLGKMLEFEPGSGRFLLFRQEALLSLRKLLIDQLGDSLSRSILAQFGYQGGYGDHHSLSRNLEWDTELDRFLAGPVMHSWEGIGRAEATFFEYDRERQHFNLRGTWTNSYEAENHLQLYGRSEHMECHTLTGYASGWSSAFMGIPIVVIETSCVARGDARCNFHGQPAPAWGPEADRWKQAFASTDHSLSRELERQLATIQQQAAEIRALSTPVLEVWDDIVVLPIVGTMNHALSANLMATVLEAIASRRAHCVILDVTGVELVDTGTVETLINVARAAALLGARCILTGIGPTIARALSTLSIDLGELVTLRSLKEGLKFAMGVLHDRAASPRAPR